MNHKLPDVQGGFRKGRGTRDQIANICWIIWELYILHGRYENSPLYSMQVKKQQLELDMEQQTGSKLGKEYVKAVYCHPAYLTYI